MDARFAIHMANMGLRRSFGDDELAFDRGKTFVAAEQRKHLLLPRGKTAFGRKSPTTFLIEHFVAASIREYPLPPAKSVAPYEQRARKRDGTCEHEDPRRLTGVGEGRD